jgi:hypothetical protein
MKQCTVCVKDCAFILCLFKSSFYTVKQHRIIAYGAFLQSRRFVVSTFCSCRRFDIRRFVFRRFVFRRFVCAPVSSLMVLLFLLSTGTNVMYRYGIGTSSSGEIGLKSGSNPWRWSIDELIKQIFIGRLTTSSIWTWDVAPVPVINNIALRHRRY